LDQPTETLSKIKIIIVDDHAIVRVGLRKILKDEPDIEVIGEADGADNLFSFLKITQPDIVLLDISMDGKNGLDIVKEIKQDYPQIKTLMLSMHPGELYAVRSIKAGAVGYITKEAASDQLVEAIREVHHKGKYITPTLAEWLVDSFELVTGNKPAHEKLSNRELQVLSLIANGKKIKEIAAELSLSPATIATYRARILEKMSLKSNVDLVSYALRNHLVN